MKTQKGFISLDKKDKNKTFFRNEKTGKQWWTSEVVELLEGKRYKAEYGVFQGTKEVKILKLEEWEVTTTWN